ncbi:MAG: UDP-N-acetylglucosamine 1-carboxyvinyltransferase [Armatimonadetes bacterium]|nr:UDP-N-acetylglucosamine 1-carboxyvinyltransferase [Armatimonadota bacterium]
MEQLRISGGAPLRGVVNLSGSKNAALSVLAGALLTEEPCLLHNVPPIKDVVTMLQVLRSIGVEVSVGDHNAIHLDASGLNTSPPPYDLVKQMRASFYVAGPLLGRLGKAKVPLPGGCVIGSRPVDFHINAFRKLGANVNVEHGFMVAECHRLQATEIYLDPRWCSVGATVNAMMAAALAKGHTVIQNPAREPEVLNFASFLNAMGAQVEGAGSKQVTVQGVERLHGCEFTVLSDRIEAGTYLFAGAMTGGDVTVEPINPTDLEFVLCKLDEAGLEIETEDNSIRVSSDRGFRAVDVATAPFPGFPTDLQPLILTLMCISEGRSVIQETIYDGRLHYVDELRRMGANVTVVNQTAVVRGVPSLSAAPVDSPDLRAGAALVVAGLAAEGDTEISGIQVIDRGYHRLEDKIAQLGGTIARFDTNGNKVNPCSDWQEILASI